MNRRLCPAQSVARVALVALALALGGLGCQGRPRPESRSGEGTSRRFGPAVAIFDVSGGLPEQEAQGLFGGQGKRSFDEFLRTAADVAEDKHAVAVLVKFGGANIGAARAQELGEQLERLREKKKVFCHADGFTNATLMAAARGCSTVYVSPAGEVESVGLAAQIVYMHRLLADELHLSVDMLQVGKYKGAEEPFTRDGPSPEARASLTGVLTDMRAAWLETITAGRKRADLGAAVEDGPYAPGRAKELGLVDDVGYPDEALSAARKAGAAARDEVVFGPGAEDRPDDLEDLVRVLAGEGGAHGPIALVRATGSISMAGGGGGLFGGRGGIVEKEFDRTIARLEKDDDVKAVVVRIDSPGGSALAADLIWHQLMKLRKKKPLVFSVGDMAASGGYYMACTGDFVFAEPMSIVGSIGVVGGKVGVGDALERIGVHAETFPANPQKPGAASRAAYMSPLVRWDEPTKARVRDTMAAVYDLFLARIVEGRSTRGRSLARSRIEESAEGRIFSGREAKSRGLVDEIGGLEAAIAKARELANLPKTAKVAPVGGKPSIFEALDPSGGSEERAPGGLGATSPLALLDRLAPDVTPFVASLAPLAEGERAVVSVPFAVQVR